MREGADQKPILFTGIAKAGKSTIGKRVAEIINYQFVDPDRVMEKKFGVDLDTLIEKVGMEKFSEIESEIVIENLLPRRVISPGGSIVYSKRAMDLAMNKALVIWLEIPIKQWLKRTGGKPPEGFLMLSSQNLEQEFAARERLYKKYHHFKVRGEQDVERVVEDVIDIIKKNLSL